MAVDKPNRLIGPLLVIALLMPVGAGMAATFPDRMQEALESWDLVTARQILAEVAGASRPRTVLATDGYIRFLQGDYAGAEDALVRSGDSGARGLLDRVRDTRAALEGFATVLSPSRRFEIRYESGMDEAMLPYLMDAADASFERLSRTMAMTVPIPIRIEIVPGTRVLASMTGESEEALDASGAVAVCKYFKIVMVSPSRTHWGYPFADTIAHELVHFFLTMRSGDRLPVWFQEAVAKYLEPTRRGDPPGTLSRTLVRLLSDAVANGRLIPVSDIRSSLIHLKGPDQVALAFAQLSSFAGFLERTAGTGVLVRMADEFRQGDQDVAVLRATGRTLAQNLEEWNRAIVREGLGRGDAPGPGGTLLRESVRDPMAGLSQELAAKVRIGDLLRHQGKHRAAVSVFESVIGAQTSPHPVLVARLTSAWIEAGQASRVLDILDRLRLDEREFAMLSRERGRALEFLGRHAEAEGPLLIAVRTDPYDPATHEALYRVMTALGRPDLADRERRLLGLWR